MSDFPKLSTGAVMQYPAGRAQAYSTRVLRFVDGAEQRYRERKAATRRWLIQLDLLTDEEAADIERFFIECQGKFGVFAFTDPWDDTLYPDCSLEDDLLVTRQADEGRTRIALIVRENRS